MTGARQTLENMMSRFLPKSVAKNLSLGQSVQPSKYHASSIAILQLHHFNKMTHFLSVPNMIKFISEINDAIESCIMDNDVHMLNDTCDLSILVSGVTGKLGKEHSQLIMDVTIRILNKLSLVRHPVSTLSNTNNKVKSLLAAFVNSCKACDHGDRKNGLSEVTHVDKLMAAQGVKVALHSGSLAAGVIGSSIPR